MSKYIASVDVYAGFCIIMKFCRGVYLNHGFFLSNIVDLSLQIQG